MSNTLKPLGVNQYQNIVLLTGAGVSVASGLPTYRGPGGLWETDGIARITHGSNLPETLPDLWELYSQRRKHALAAEPNAAHLAIAHLQKSAMPGQSVTLLTQNVDNLHQRAGSPDVSELHGSAFRTRCTNPRCDLPPFVDETVYQNQVPMCPRCKKALRPDIVLFGEMLSEDVLGRARQSLRQCDLFIAVGTSGVVWPAAKFVEIAASVGARTVLVNLVPTERSQAAFGEEYYGKAEETLPLLLS